jgi:hypothetical protein
MIEQYLAVSRSKNIIPPACIWQTPVWRYLLYKTRQDVFGDVKFDPAIPSEPFSAQAVIIDGFEYTRRDLAGVRANPGSWTQEGELLYVHYVTSWPAWLFLSHVYGIVIGRSSGKTRFFDGYKYTAGLDIKLSYQIEADNLEYAKMKLTGNTYAIPARGEFDSITDILGNDLETSWSTDGVTKTPLNTRFIESAEVTLGEVSLRAADKREKLNVPVAAEVFTPEEYPKMKETFYGKNKQEVFGFCRGIPAVCVDQRDIYAWILYKNYRTFRVAGVITSLTKVEVKMTQPKDDQNKDGDVWVDQTGYQSTDDYANGRFTLPASRCLPLLPNGQPDYGNEPYDVRVTGTFRTNGTHWAILSDLLATAMGNTWTQQCNTGEMQNELFGTGTVGLFIEKETKIFEIIETLQSSGIYGWQLHDYRGKLTIRKDNNNRGPLASKKIRSVDIRNINEVSVSLGMDNYATVVEVKYQRNYSEKSNDDKSNNTLRDASNRGTLFPVYRNDKTYTAESYLEYAADVRLLANYLIGHFSVPRPMIKGIVLSGSSWLTLRLYDIIGVYLERELKQEKVPLMLMVLSNEIRRQEAAVFGAAQKVYYVRDKREAEKRRFGGNIYIKVMRIEHDISTLTTTIDGLYIRNL